MGEFKGTKGKWEYSDGDNSSIDIVLENNSTISIDRFDRYGSGLVGTREEMQANAKLISKAPEMLELLEEFITHHFDFMGCGEIKELQEDAKKLIKEATEP